MSLVSTKEPYIPGEFEGAHAIIIQEVTEGKKYDQGKAPVMQGLFQFFPKALKEVAMHSAYGAEKYKEKYEDKNWSKVEDGKNRYADALGRHILDQFIDGPIDPESKRLHACAIAWNALAYLEKILEEEIND